jgi:hypothetical protein
LFRIRTDSSSIARVTSFAATSSRSLERRVTAAWKRTGSFTSSRKRVASSQEASDFSPWRMESSWIFGSTLRA